MRYTKLGRIFYQEMENLQITVLVALLMPFALFHYGIEKLKKKNDVSNG